MNDQRMKAIQEDLMECEGLPELKAMWCNWQAEAPDVASHPLCTLMVRSTINRLRLFAKPPVQGVGEVQEQLNEMVHNVAEARAMNVGAWNQKYALNKKYVLLKKDVAWSTKPQVHALMAIIGAHANEGDVLAEYDIVNMVEANKEVLNTRQPAKRIWDYYKGDHNEGLMAHGNMRRA